MGTGIIIGADHGGFDRKEEIKEYLTSKGFSVEDVGAYSKDSVDYPDFANKVSEKVADGTFSRGIVVCTSGIGVSMVANKSKGVRAALCTSIEQARLSRLHNDANVLAIGSKFSDTETVREMCDVWISTEFEGGRHTRRVDKIANIEKRIDNIQE